MEKCLISKLKSSAIVQCNCETIDSTPLSGVALTDHQKTTRWKTGLPSIDENIAVTDTIDSNLDSEPISGISSGQEVYHKRETQDYCLIIRLVT